MLTIRYHILTAIGCYALSLLETMIFLGILHVRLHAVIAQVVHRGGLLVDYQKTHGMILLFLTEILTKHVFLLS